MGQKVSPISYRTSVKKNWRSLWYGNKKEFGDLLVEDFRLRQFLTKRSSCQGASKFTIKRMSDKIEITIHTSKPGLAIGKKGAEIELLKSELRKFTGKEVWIEIEEIKRPDLDATLVAQGIARQLKRRIAFRRAMKKALQATMDAGAVGVKIQVSGRVGGAEIARTEWYKEGRIPLHTLRANIDYAIVRSETTYGTLGVKVWINHGEDSKQDKEK
ncbi:MAG: 30S ribosomal protein S3 [Chlamydiales bacterium]|nr:30S ribosomal protein S3 [Chlamydiales bacterium]MCH9619776.1 30S ribosomal protein S3 [Chlamydiales bacterium]MCH9623382.1 30S ribosomal protein S3 [Chlamydiales bacterium]